MALILSLGFSGSDYSLHEDEREVENDPSSRRSVLPFSFVQQLPAIFWPFPVMEHTMLCPKEI